MHRAGVALAGVTPADAVNAVKRALFATNSGAVNGIKASKKPAANKLFPLGSDGRFPASVIPPLPVSRGPVGPAGPPGVQGIQGAAGAPGPSDVRTVGGSSTPTARTANARVTMLTLAAIPAGTYLLTFTGTSAFDGASNTVVACELLAGPDLLGRTRLDLGLAAGGVAIGSMAATAVVTEPAAFTATVQCYPSNDIAVAQTPILDDSRLTALHVGQAL